MQRIFHAMIEFFYWIAIFISPLLICSAIGFVIYIKSPNLLLLSIFFAALGAVLGFMFAERIRKKYGCSRYMAKILGTPDIWPDEYPEEIEAREKEIQMKESKKKINK